jgi:hypothetical protein
VKRLVTIQYDLHEIFPCGHVPEVSGRPPEGAVVNSQGPVCPKGLDVDAKDVGDLERLISVNVIPRLPRQIRTQEQNGPSIDGHASGRGGQGHDNARALLRSPSVARRNKARGYRQNGDDYPIDKRLTIHPAFVKTNLP